MKALPEDYVTKQFLINQVHLDGQVENEDDEEHAWEIIDYVTDHFTDPRSFLVLGCRTGYECRCLARRFYRARVVGMDIVPQFIDMAEIYANQQGLQVDFLKGDMHSLPFSEGEFDGIICRGTLEHCYDVSRAAAEMQRVARRWIYVTADLQSEDTKNPGNSDYTVSDDPEFWKGRFQAPWRLKASETNDGFRCPVLQMLWEKP